MKKTLSIRTGNAAGHSDRRESWGVSPGRLERLRDHAREMRRNPTEPERTLWERIQGQKLGGFKFERQKVIGSTIADFACEARWLTVEVDGDAHDTPAIDEMRDKKLTDVGLRVLRFTAEQVMQELDSVCEAILLELEKPFDRRQAAREAALSHTPTPSPEAEGEDAAEAQKLLGNSLEGPEG